MPHFFRNTLTSLLLLLCASAPALTVKDIANALDNPAGVTFSAPKGDMGTEKKFSDSYLLGEVIPVGGTMLKLKAGS